MNDKSDILALVLFYHSKCYLRIDPGVNIPQLEGITAFDDKLMHFYVAIHKWLVVPFRKLFQPGRECGFPVRFLVVLDDSVYERLKATRAAVF